MKEYKCPKCNSEKTVKHGFVVTVKVGKKQRRKCQECGHTFNENNGGQVGKS